MQNPISDRTTSVNGMLSMIPPLYTFFKGMDFTLHLHTIIPYKIQNATDTLSTIPFKKLRVGGGVCNNYGVELFFVHFQTPHPMRFLIEIALIRFKTYRSSERNLPVYPNRQLEG